MTALALPIVVSLFDTAFPTGPAYGTEEHTTWQAFAAWFRERRQGAKDGANFIPARFRPEPDGRVRRLLANVAARTGIALDIEANKETGEVPPPFYEAVARVRAEGWAGVIYTSHSHTPAAPRYRIVLPPSAEIAPTLPAVEVIADQLGRSGVLDRGKVGPASLFYFPSAEPGHLANHQVVVIDGAPIDAVWMQERAGAILAAREAKHARERAEALEAAARRRAERIKAGFDPDDSLIEKIRDRLDLAEVLLLHGYPKVGSRYLYPNSQSGVPGVHVLRGDDGVERVFSHHAGDPLAAGNLPSWCRVKAIDVVDVLAILDFNGDQKRALSALAKWFDIESESKKQERERRKASRRTLRRLACNLIRQRVPDLEILRRLDQTNAALEFPVSDVDIGEIAIWAARAVGSERASR